MGVLIFHLETEAPPARVGSHFPPAVKHEIKALGAVLVDPYEGSVQSKILRSSAPERLISAFFKLLRKKTPILVSFNGSFFGLPVLLYSALRYGISMEDLSQYFRRGFHHEDLADKLTLDGAGVAVSLEDAGKLIGFPERFGAPAARNLEADLLLLTSLWARFKLISGGTVGIPTDTYKTIVKQSLERIPAPDSYKESIDRDRLFNHKA